VILRLKIVCYKQKPSMRAGEAIVIDPAERAGRACPAKFSTFGILEKPHYQAENKFFDSHFVL
jgi:hypothetical protein